VSPLLDLDQGFISRARANAAIGRGKGHQASFTESQRIYVHPLSWIESRSSGAPALGTSRREGRFLKKQNLRQLKFYRLSKQKIAGY
jgi:hypothetical protein